MGKGRVIFTREMLVSTMSDRWSAEEIDRAAELLAKGGGRFPSGTRGLPGQFVKEVQRERLLAGMLKAVAERSYGAVTVQDALDRSGISRPTFYENFTNKEECFLIALDGSMRRLSNRVRTAASEGGKGWRERLRMGLAELLRFAAAEPDTARALIVEARAAGSAALLRREQLLDRFAEWISSAAREELPDAPSSITAAGVVGGIETVLYTHVNQGETELLSLLPSLMYFAVLPYGGREAAAEELRDAAVA